MVGGALTTPSQWQQLFLKGSFSPLGFWSGFCLGVFYPSSSKGQKTGESFSSPKESFSGLPPTGLLLLGPGLHPCPQNAALELGNKGYSEVEEDKRHMAAGTEKLRDGEEKSKQSIIVCRVSVTLATSLRWAAMAVVVVPVLQVSLLRFRVTDLSQTGG